MFTKLKKKLETEGGFVPNMAEFPGRAVAGHRDSVTSLPRAGSMQYLGISPPGSLAGDSVCVLDDSVPREELISLLQKKAEQSKKLEANISELAALVKDKSKNIERLEAALKQQEESSNRSLEEQKKEFEGLVTDLTQGQQNLRQSKLVNTQEALAASTSEADGLKLKLAALEAQIQQLKEDHSEQSELAAGLRQHKLELEKKLVDASNEIDDTQGQVTQLQTQLRSISDEFRIYRSQSEQHTSESTKLLQDKDELLAELQDRVRTLEQRVSDSCLSGDDQTRALEADRKRLEHKLAEMRTQAAQMKSDFQTTVSSLKTQISQLNVQIAEDSEKLVTSNKKIDQTQEKFVKQVAELEQELARQKSEALNCEHLLKAKLASQEVHIQQLEDSRDRQAKEANSKITHLEEQVSRYVTKEIKQEDQVAVLEEAVRQLQVLASSKTQEVDTLTLRVQAGAATEEQLHQTILKQRQELSDLKSSYEKLVEQNQRLDADLRAARQENQELLDLQADLKRQEQLLTSQNRDLSQQMELVHNHKMEVEASLRQRLQSLEHLVSQNEKSEAALYLNSEKVEELNGVIADLQTQLADKTRIVKKQEQTLKDLRVTLQRELRVQSLPNDETNDTANLTNSSTPQSATSNRLPINYQFNPQSQASQPHKESSPQPHKELSPQPHYGQPHPSHLPAQAAVLSLHSSLSPSNIVTLTSSSSSVTNCVPDALASHVEHVKRELDKDINFLYLKHVILKFMLSREAEAMHLIKAVSMLLNFSHQEQQLIRETLEWKMSWFGHRPQLGEGQKAKVIPPAI